MKKAHIIGVTVLLYLLLQGLVGYFFYLRYTSDVQEQITTGKLHFLNTYQTIFNIQRKIPNTIFESILNRPYLIEKIASANTDKQKKDTIRKGLYKILNPIYEDTLLPLEISQLEIYLKNGERLIQFQKPLKYGDTPLMKDSALQKVTSSQKFQEGISSTDNSIQYNYYYPIFSKGNFIGTFHLAVPLKTYTNEGLKSLQYTQGILLTQDKKSQNESIIK